MSQRTEIARRDRTEIAPRDRAWFDRVCRAQARIGCRGRTELCEDAEGEARLRAWRAYRDGKAPGAVALAALSGARAHFRAERCRMERDPRTGRWRAVPGGRAALSAAPLTLTGADGGEYDNPAILRAGRSGQSAEAAALGRLAAESLRAAVAALPAREAALVRRVQGGERPSHLAAEAGVSQQAVSKSYHCALRRLRACPEAADWLAP